MKQKYGESVFQRYFNQDSSNLLHLLREWRVNTPDRYILIQCLVSLKTEDMLSQKSIKYDVIRKVLLKMRDSDYIVTPAYIAKALGIAKGRVPEIAQKCGIEPFWKLDNHGKRRTSYKGVHLHFTKEEYDIVEAFWKKHSSLRLGNYLREYILGAIETEKQTQG